MSFLSPVIPDFTDIVLGKCTDLGMDLVVVAELVGIVGRLARKLVLERTRPRTQRIHWEAPVGLDGLRSSE